MKKITIVIMALLCLITLAVVSCSKSSEDKITPQNVTPCDTANSTYNADVVPILKANCYSCHGNGEASGGVELDVYSNVKNVAQNGVFIGVITHASGYPAMPLGGAQLSACNINTIKSWITNGALNN